MLNRHEEAIQKTIPERLDELENRVNLRFLAVAELIERSVDPDKRSSIIREALEILRGNGSSTVSEDGASG